MIPLLCAAFLTGAPVATSHAGAQPRTRVYVIIVDGLDARMVSATSTPHLWQLIHGGDDRAVFYPAGRAAMLAVTNTNHASLGTGLWAGAHGIVGNKLVLDDTIVPSEDARRLEAETIVTVAERERPALVSAVVVGKMRLVSLFAAVPDQQLAPDVSWGDAETENEAFDPKRGGFGSDRRTMDQVLKTIASADPDFLLVNLPDVDRTGHLTGPDSPETLRAVAGADAQLLRLIETAKHRDTWNQTVLFITADHGMTAVTPDATAGRPFPLVPLGRELARAQVNGVTLLANGAGVGRTKHRSRVTFS